MLIKKNVLKGILFLFALNSVLVQGQNPGVIWDGDFIKNFRPNIKLLEAAYIRTGTDDPTSVAVEAPKGSLYLRQGTTGEVYFKTDDGSSTNWTLIDNGGDVFGPAGATDNALVRFDTNTGLLLQDSGAILDDSNNLSGIADLTIGGALTGVTSLTMNGALSGVTDLTATGTTTLDTALSGVVKAASGVISASDVDLTSEVTGVLPIANGGTNSSTALNNDRVIVSNGGAIVESATTTTELGYLDATSSIQTQLNAKLDDVVTANDNEVPRFDTDGQALQNSSVTIDDSDNISGVVGLTVTGDITTAETASRALQTDGAGAIEASAVTSIELGYVSGVTSAIQTQLNAKLDDVGTANDNEIVRFDTNGQALQNTSVTIDDNDNVAAIASLNLVDQASAPSNPSADDATLFVQDDYLFQQNSVGDSKLIYPKNNNYLEKFDAELNIDGVTAYADAAGTTPVDGTGGSPTVSVERTTTSGEVLRDNASYALVKDGSDRQGEGLAIDFTIAPADENKVFYTGFDVKTSANYNSGDVVVYIYDVDNATLITPTNTEILAATSDGARFETTWAATDSNNYRFILHVATTNASAYDVYFDDVDINARKIGSVPAPPKQYDENDVTFSNTPTGWSVNSARFVPYKTRNGDWRLTFNINAAQTATTGDVTFDIDGVTTINNSQAITAAATTSSLDYSARIQTSSGTVDIKNIDGVSNNQLWVSGDVALASKPTWADEPVSVNIYTEDNLTSGTWTPTTNSDDNLNGTASYSGATYYRIGNYVSAKIEAITGLTINTAGNDKTGIEVDFSDLPGVENTTNPYSGGATVRENNDNFIERPSNVRTPSISRTTVQIDFDANDFDSSDSITIFNVHFWYEIAPTNAAYINQQSLVGFAGATAERGGLVTTGDQTFAGTKTIVGSTNSTGDLMVLQNSDKDVRYEFEMFNDDPALSMFDSTNTRTALINTDGVSYFNGGNVGIGTSSPDGPLHVSASGNARAYIEGTNDVELVFQKSGSNIWVIGSDASNSDRFNILDGGRDDGVIMAENANSFSPFSSDRRLKDSIEDVGIGLAEVMKIEPVKYFRKHWSEEERQNGKEYGYIAQNVKEYFPAMTMGTGRFSETGDEYLTIKPMYMLPVLHKAIQEQQAIIDELKQRIEDLEQQ